MNRIQFLKTLYPEPPRGGLVLYTWSNRGQELSKWIQTCLEADRFADSKRKSCDIYFHAPLQRQSRVMELTRERYAGRRATMVRGSASGAYLVPALWAELDFAGTTHRGRHLPPEEAAALSLLDAVAPRPSIVVATGGGYQLYWLLREPLRVVTDADRQHAGDLLRRLQGAFAAAAAERGWRLPKGGNLGRLLRLPGTLNHKAGQPLKVKVVRELLAGLAQGRYRVEDFDGLAPSPPLLVRAAPLLRHGRRAEGDFEPVFRGCGFLQYCWKHRDELSFEAWLVLASIVGLLALPGVDGSRLYHRMSRGFPGYRHGETEWRLRQVLAAGEPATCDDVGKLGFGGICARCDHAGRLASPIDLGRCSGHAAQPGVSSVPEGRHGGLPLQENRRGRPPCLPSGALTAPDQESPPCPEPAADDRPRSALTPCDDQVADQALAALAGRERQLLQRGGALVRLARQGGETAVSRVRQACLRQLVRAAVVWAGLPTPAARRRDLETAAAAEETAVGTLLRALSAWIEARGGAVSSSQILEALAGDDDGRDAALRAAVAGLFPGLDRGRLPTARELTERLAAWHGVEVGGHCLERARRSYRGVRWRVRASGPGVPAASGGPGASGVQGASGVRGGEGAAAAEHRGPQEP